MKRHAISAGNPAQEREMFSGAARLCDAKEESRMQAWLRHIFASVPILSFFLLILSCGGNPLMAQIQAHAVYEPPDAPVFEPSANTFLNAKATAARHWSDRVPELAVDGQHTDPGSHWAGEDIPVWLTVEMKEPQEINTIRLWTWWNHRRHYQYFIEGSLDGESWALLADHRQNATPATERGETFHFPAARVRFVRVTFTHNSDSDRAGGHIVEIEGYLLRPEQIENLAAKDVPWKTAGTGLQGAFGSTDARYARDAVPTGVKGSKWKGRAWQGERLSAQLVLWTSSGARQVRVEATPLRHQSGGELPPDCVRPAFVRYVLADGRVVPDVLDTLEQLDLPPRTSRPIWLSIDIPARARPGRYRGEVHVRAEGGRSLSFELEVELLPVRLPPPSRWKFWLDLWQNPYAVARYHHVEPWSQEHLRLLEPHLRLLASAGQKCVTTTIVYQPWGTQTYDPYDSMVAWVRRKDASWEFDYSRFDQYVALCARCGIKEAIHCYSMAPWGAIRYLDEATGDYAWAHVRPGTPEYEQIWRPFLKDFVAHLQKRGWLAKTAIAVDEQPPEIMRPLIAFVRSAAPSLKLALAGSNDPQLKEAIDDWCVFIAPPLDPAIARERSGRGLPTTFYVCCGPGKPNTFTFSPPAEATWMGWYAAAKGYTGFLRWAYDSWVHDPLYDTRFVTWPAGDCFLVYPGARSSIRFERLREGIQDYEKIRLIRATLGRRKDAEARAGLQQLEEVLSRFTWEAVQETPASETVNAAKEVLAELSRILWEDGR